MDLGHDPKVFINLTVSYIPIAYYLILHNSTLNFSNLLFSFLNACLISLRYHYLPQTSLTLASASLLVFTLLTGQLPVLTQWDSWVLSLPVRSQRKAVWQIIVVDKCINGRSQLVALWSTRLGGYLSDRRRLFVWCPGGSNFNIS